MKVRYATLDDIPDLVRLNSLEVWHDSNAWESFTQFQRWSEGVWLCDPDLLKWYFSILKRSDGGIIVATEDDLIVGQLDYCKSNDLIGSFNGTRYHIVWVLTHRNFRRQGIAERLIRSLMDSTKHPIWVEPEDKRSEKLYQKIGEQVFSISNWSLTLQNITEYILDHRLSPRAISYDDITTVSSRLSLLLGRYYAPDYDRLQLQYSTPVAQYMWGDTGGPNLQHYQLGKTNVYAILTQYPRLWVNQDFGKKELKQIIAALTLDIFEQGFDTIYFQIYNGLGIEDILRSLNYHCYINDDPVYQISSPQ